MPTTPEGFAPPRARWNSPSAESLLQTIIGMAVPIPALSQSAAIAFRGERYWIKDILLSAQEGVIVVTTDSEDGCIKLRWLQESASFIRRHADGWANAPMRIMVGDTRTVVQGIDYQAGLIVIQVN